MLAGSFWLLIFFPPSILATLRSATSYATVVVWLLCVGAFLWSFQAFFRTIRKRHRQLSDILENVNQFADGQIDFDTLNDRLSTNGASGVARAWSDYEATLLRIPIAEKGVRVYATIPARHLIDQERLVAGNLGIHLHVPSLLTGLGILGTFLGLSLGLSNADLAAEEVNTLKEGLRSLLAGAHTAFVTSVWGILLSLVLSGIQKLKLDGLVKLHDKLCDSLDQLFPRKQAEAWLSEVWSEARQQTSELKKFNTDIAFSIAAALEEKLATRLTPALNNLLTAIEKLTEAGSAEVARVISREAGEEVVRLGDILQQASDALGKTLEMSSEVQRSVSETVAQQLALTVSHVEQSLSSSTSRFEELVLKIERAVGQVGQSLGEQVTWQRQHAEELMAKMQETVQAHLEGFLARIEETVGRVTNETGSAVESMSGEVNRLLDELGEKMAALGTEYEARRNELRSAVDEITALLAMIEKLVKEAAGVLSAYGETAKPVREAGLALGKAVATLAGAGNMLEQATREFKNFWDEYRQFSTRSVSEIKDALQHTESAWRAYETRFGQLRGELESVFETLEHGLRSYTQLVGEGLARYLQELDGEVSKAVSSLANAIGSLEETLADFVGQLHERR